MTNDDIRKHIEELETAVTADDAQLVLYCEDLDQQAFELIGNRKGYLRAGIEMLKAAVVPMQPGDSITPVKIDYLIRNDRSLRVNRLTRQEDVDSALPPVKQNTWKDKAIGIGCLAFAVFLVVCTFIGIGQVFAWIFGIRI